MAEQGRAERGGPRSLLIASLAAIAGIGVWGVIDPASLLAYAEKAVDDFFRSRGWFVMLSTAGMLALCLGLAASPLGRLRLGADDDRPEFSTASWIAMLFAAGMGVGLLFWASAEPLTHFAFVRGMGAPDFTAAEEALLATNFHWGIHAWAIYGATALAIAYFSFRRGAPMLVGAPLVALFPGERWARVVAWLSDFMAMVAIAVGVGGSVAMGVMQVADGANVLFGGGGAPPSWLVWATLAVMVAAWTPPLMVDLGEGMSRLSNLAMLIAIGLVIWTVVFGPTQFLMNSILTGAADYMADALPRGLRTFTFFDDAVGRWFKDWTLTYMVWWIAWGPFVGVFVARISKGRTIREFVIGVLAAPTLFSMVWFGAFGGIGIFETLRGAGELLALTETNVERVTFALLQRLPLSFLTILATVAAAFLFIVTSVVSAGFVLGGMATGGDPDPPAKVRVAWGALLALMSVAMLLSGSVNQVKLLISMGALPFVFILVMLLVCLLRALRDETAPAKENA